MKWPLPVQDLQISWRQQRNSENSKKWKKPKVNYVGIFCVHCDFLRRNIQSYARWALDAHGRSPCRNCDLQTIFPVSQQVIKLTL